MRAHWSYLKYVLRHKWFVFVACLRYRVPLHQAVIHDWTKFLPLEWGPYVHQFYNPDGSKKGAIRRADGSYDPAAQPEKFQRAWLHHQRQKHHWQAWVVLGDEGWNYALPMPRRYVREMVADWTGAGRAIAGETNPLPWYEKNRERMTLHPETRAQVEELLGVPVLRALREAADQ